MAAAVAGREGLKGVIALAENFVPGGDAERADGRAVLVEEAVQLSEPKTEE